MRYLLDTNIFIYLATDRGMIAEDVYYALNEPDAELYVSAEEMVRSIEETFYVRILPLQREHMQTYSRLRPYIQHGHKDPSDHIIISHAITERLILVSSDTRFPFYRNQGLQLLYNEK